MGRWLLCISLLGCGRWGFGSEAIRDDGKDASDPSDASAGSGDGDISDARDAAAMMVDALPSSLVAWYRFEDELTDLKSTDATGQHHATCVGPCPNPSTGHIGSAVDFQGTNSDGLEVPDHPDLRVTTLTIAVWARHQTGGGFAAAISKPLGATTANSFQIDIDDLGVPRFNTHDGSGTSRVVGPTMMPNVWTHLAGTHDGVRMRFYVNATEVDTMLAPLAAYDTQSVFLGADRNGGSSAESFDGSLDDIRIYNVALSQAEIAVLAQ